MGERNASGFYHHSLWGKRMIYINFEGVNIFLLSTTIIIIGAVCDRILSFEQKPNKKLNS